MPPKKGPGKGKAKKALGVKKTKKTKTTQAAPKPGDQWTVQQTEYRPMQHMVIGDGDHPPGRTRKSVFKWLCLSIVCFTLALVLSRTSIHARRSDSLG